MKDMGTIEEGPGESLNLLRAEDIEKNQGEDTGRRDMTMPMWRIPK